MRALLKIPYSEKDNAKEIAKANRSALFFTPEKVWEFRGLVMPKELEKYVTTYLEEDTLEVKRTTKVNETNKEKLDKKSTNKENNNLEYSYVLDIPFVFRNSIIQYKGYYDSDYKTYILKTKEVPKQLQSYMSKPFSYEAYVEKIINKDKIRRDFFNNTEEKIKPRSYQSEAHKFILNSMKRKLGAFLLADEVGLGKTISAGLLAQEKPYQKILVVTTLSAVAHWRKTFLKMSLEKKEIIIINYDRLQKLFKEDATRYKNKAKTKKVKNRRLAISAEPMGFDLIIWDESHKMRNNTSLRSKLGRKLALEANFNLYLSATAGQNPLELSYLAPLLAKITGQSVSSMDEFEKWCKKMNLGVSRGDYGKWLWDGSDESIEKIHSLLFKGKEPAALRRIPSDIAGYPEISRELTPLELSPDEQYQYELAWEEFKATMNNLPKGKMKKGEENALVAKLRLRQKASLLKVPYTLEYIEDLLEKGHQVAVSVNFKDSMYEIEKGLSKLKITCSKIHGELNPNEKEDERLKFQKGENKVVLFTVEEAISLHQGEYNNVPRSMLIHDLRWSAIPMSQIEGRTHRDGKFSQIYWLYFEGTIEHDIAIIVLNRVISMKAMVGDDTKTLKEIEQLLQSKVKD